MEQSIEVTGQSVDEAVDKALETLNVSEDEVLVEVVEEKRQGFLGLGKEFLVRVSTRNNEYDEEIVVEINNYIKPLLDKMAFEANTTVTLDEETYFIDISGEDLGLLIGKHGETIQAIQTIVSAHLSHVLQKRVYISVDVEGYKQNRNEKLIGMAKKTAEKVAESGRSVALKPMSPGDRRIIHVALKDSSTVVTASEGDEPYRQVLIIPRHIS